MYHVDSPKVNEGGTLNRRQSKTNLLGFAAAINTIKKFVGQVSKVKSSHSSFHLILRYVFYYIIQ